MQEEIAICERMCVWKRTTLPPGRQVVGCGWVLTIKRNAPGEIERFRAKLVAQGYSQLPGVHYDEVYAPTHRMTILRALIAVGAAHDFEIKHLDVRTAYLNAPLEHEIYMKMPPGYSEDEGDDGEVLKLEKALYGLKQAGRMWHQKLKETRKVSAWRNLMTACTSCLTRRRECYSWFMWTTCSFAAELRMSGESRSK